VEFSDIAHDRSWPIAEIGSAEKQNRFMAAFWLKAEVHPFE